MEHLGNLWSEHKLLPAVGVVVLVALALVLGRLLLRKRGGNHARKPALDRSLGRRNLGQDEDEAERELKAGHLSQAYDLFLRAQQPVRAAQVAVRQGRLPEAAQLFEKAGHRKRAAELYQQVGMQPKAEALLAEEERLHRERVEQKEELRRRLTSEASDADDEEDRLALRAPPAPKVEDAPAAKRPPATAGLDLGPAALAAPASAPDPAGAAKPGEPSLFGIQALVDKAAAKVATEDLALAPTQASMAAPVPAANASIVPPGLEREALGLRHVADAAVAGARQGPTIAELQSALEAQGAEAGVEDTLHSLGLALIAAGRWREAAEAFARVERISPGYRDAAARAQELGRWLAAVGTLPLSLAHADGKATRYTLLGELGRGAKSVVYRALDEGARREVALKYVAQGVGNDPTARALLHDQARAAARLSHRNIVTVYDVGEQDGKTFVGMELVDGSTVAQLLETSGPLPAGKAATIILQALEALQFAHDRQVIHRDLKPANLMLARDGGVKVMNFGLAERGEGSDPSATLAGSPSYGAPEQIRGETMDGRTDLFAAGASLYEMLTGRPPFSGPDRAQPPKPMRAIVASLPEALDGLVTRALEFDPERRFASAAEMAQAVRAFLEISGPGALGVASGGELGRTPEARGPASPPGSAAAAIAAPVVAGAPAHGQPASPPRELAREALAPWSATRRPGSAEPSALAESPVAEVPPVEVEVAPEVLARPARTTPRTPIPAVGPSLGTYRMVRPAAEPDVFTPAPTPRPQSGERATPAPARGRTASGEARVPTPGPRLSLAAKPATGGTPPSAPAVAATRATPPPLPPATPSPGPGTKPKGTALGIGPHRSGK